MNELAQDSALLRERYKSSRDVKEKERYHALYLYSAGYQKIEIATIFCRDEDTIKSWVDKWIEDKSVNDVPKEGRPAKFDEKDKDRVKQLVEENNPKKHGINASIWDCRELQKYFLLKGKNVSEETIRLSLRNMGARYVKAQLHYAEADLEMQEEFARQFFKDMRAKQNSIVVLFQDEMSVSCSPKKGYGWTFEERLIVNAPQKGGRKRLNCFGAVNPFRGELTQLTSSESKSFVLVRFLNKIAEKYRGKRVWLYMDNLPVHKCDAVKEFLQKNKSIELRFIPPYSPELNIQEHWWNYQRRKFLDNHIFRSKHQLATALGGFVRSTPAEQVMKTCSLAPLERLL